MDEWSGLSRWWEEEVRGDPAYREEVLPLLLELAGEPDLLLLDLGCGEGQGLRALAGAGARPFGCDLNQDLLRSARRFAPVVRARLPELAWVRPGALDGVVAVLVLEHLADADQLFAEARRVVRAGGVFVLVANHPLVTAPGAGPVVDPDDGEMLWRWGAYLEEGSTREPAGEGKVTFFHRSLSTVLEAAASRGWRLERLLERGVGEGATRRDPLLALQQGLPRLLGARWRRE